MPVREGAFRRGHRVGNRVLTAAICGIFTSRFSDILSGYKVMSRRFVKSFPALASGFETETELVVHALELRMQVAEVEVSYRERPRDSTSKLSTARDGVRIFRTILSLVREERPLLTFTLASATLALTSLLPAVILGIAISGLGTALEMGDVHIPRKEGEGLGPVAGLRGGL